MTRKRDRNSDNLIISILSEYLIDSLEITTFFFEFEKKPFIKTVEYFHRKFNEFSSKKFSFSTTKKAPKEQFLFLTIIEKEVMRLRLQFRFRNGLIKTKQMETIKIVSFDFVFLFFFFCKKSNEFRTKKSFLLCLKE